MNFLFQTVYSIIKNLKLILEQRVILYARVPYLAVKLAKNIKRKMTMNF